MNAALQIGSKSIDTPTLLQKLLQYRLLETFVKETIIEELIEDVTCDSTVAYERFCQKRQLQTDEQQQAWRKQSHLSAEQMQLEAEREMRLQLFKENTWGDRLQTFFLQRKEKFDRVVYSLIRTQNKELAYELYFRLCDDGDSFADVARQYSEGKESQTGGLVGPVEMSVPHPMLAKMLRISQEGQLWEPTKIGDWMTIVRCEKLIPAQLNEPMRQRLLQEQFQTLLNQRMQASPVKLMPPGRSPQGTKISEQQITSQTVNKKAIKKQVKKVTSAQKTLQSQAAQDQNTQNQNAQSQNAQNQIKPTEDTVDVLASTVKGLPSVDSLALESDVAETGAIRA
ncbi:MAG: peptidylprolyl isomerase [Cyanobacteria bacterium P01_D01_bin.105]